MRTYRLEFPAFTVSTFSKLGKYYKYAKTHQYMQKRIDEILGSKVRFKILSLFVSNPKREFYEREIADAISVNQSSVNRQIGMLVDVGALNGWHSGNQKIYRLNESFYAVRALRELFTTPSALGRKKAQEFVKRLKKHGSVKKAVLFGSVFEGRADLDSDIDIAVVANKKLESAMNKIASDLDDYLVNMPVRPMVVKTVTFEGERID